jgi:hypothetical protein
MKRKETKSNNSKHPVKKLIALWVVFALLIVPFANHVGDKNGAKAEGGSATGAVKGLSPTDEELKNVEDHTFLVDWIRVYTLIPEE